MLTKTALKHTAGLRDLKIADKTTRVSHHVRVSASSVTNIVDCWRIFARVRHHFPGGSVLFYLHVMLLVLGKATVILHNIGVTT